MWGSRWVVGFVCIATAALGLVGCQSREPAPAMVYSIPRPPPCPPPFTQQGRASFYGDAHHGQTTASGDEFDKSGMTAAHRTLPLGTTARVTNLENGRSVEVRVNDRGPFVSGRVIDLSPKAAKRLHMTNDGVVPVRLDVVAAWMAEE